MMNCVITILAKCESPSLTLTKLLKSRWLTNELVGLEKYATTQISHHGNKVHIMVVVEVNTPEVYYIAVAFFNATCRKNNQPIE